ncbi:hypothetical protein N7509_008203 [Penicillium cosmopolitanum]|uniref:Uncharacterized protein n=1 Tax=Penicillium cosmopolitanum TaxID=1131564 RepID=A0A9W9VM55_9EURO|nr:uncharacterized protein N7509_008203 [Penicillium cosmopolitanum]KAJ5385662.1 hypothetical protein N7509_008203 [Penicillium cosmopolitanum]
MPLDLGEILQEDEIRSICRYAGLNLADRMFKRGLDLAFVIQKDPVLWFEIVMYHPNPIELFDWLYSRHCLPPSNLRIFDADPAALMAWELRNGVPVTRASPGEKSMQEFAIQCGNLEAAY